MRRFAVLLAVLALAPLVSCGDDGGQSADDGEPGDEVQTTPLTFGDGDEVWLRVATGGGFVPMIFVQREVPSVLLFDDGRLVRNVVEDGSNGIVPLFEEVQLDETEAADLLADVAAVVDGPALGNPPVTDLATTTIEVTTDGETRTLDVYALGVDDGLSPEATAARQAAQETLAGIQEIGTAEPYVTRGVVRADDRARGRRAVDRGHTVPPRPGAGGLARRRRGSAPASRATRSTWSSTRCPGSTATTPIDTGTTLAEVALRPVLTGEETCNLGEFDDFVER